MTLEVSGIRFAGELAAKLCDACNEALLSAAELERFELAVAERLAALGVRTGESFKFMRKALGLRAVDLAALLDVASETVSHWETGKPEARAFALLGSMVMDRLAGSERTVDSLRVLASDKRRPTRVRVQGA
jgi:DNA-binding transcriptional regulator YiaG